MEVIIDKTSNWRDYKVLNRDTGEEVKFCWAADDETGEYATFENDGKHITKVDGGVRSLTQTGNIELVKAKGYKTKGG